MRPSPRPAPRVQSTRMPQPARPALRAFRVQRGDDPPVEHAGTATIGDPPAATLTERGGRVYLAAAAPAAADDGGSLAPLAAVWIDGVQARAGVSYLCGAATRVTLAADGGDAAFTVTYDVADGAGGDAVAALAAAALAAGASEDVREALKDAGAL